MINKKRSIQKRSFLLIELLISLALVACCLFPLIKPHVSIHKSERKALEQMQIEMHVERAFCLLKQYLYEQKITWKQLQKNEGVGGELGLKNVEVFIKEKESRPFICTYHLQMPKDGSAYKKSPRRDVCILNVEFTFTPASGDELKFHRTLFVEQIPKEAA